MSQEEKRICNKQRKEQNEREKMRGIMEVHREVKSLKLKFYPKNTRNEAMICFSTEKEAQLAIREINIYRGWKTELNKPIRNQ